MYNAAQERYKKGWKKMNRRHFLKNSGLGTMGVLSASAAVITTPLLGHASNAPINQTWKRYNGSNYLNNLTISASQMPKRDEWLRKLEDSIPTKERLQQIHSVVIRHTVAEEEGNLDETMATLTDKPIFEDVASGKTTVGHKDVFNDYKERYSAFPNMQRHITNMMIDNNGCFVELMWEGHQAGPIRGLSAPKNRPKIYLPNTVYFSVTEEGKISRETVYYDQYLMAMNVDIIPDIMNNPLQLAFLNPGIIARKQK